MQILIIILTVFSLLSIIGIVFLLLRLNRSNPDIDNKFQQLEKSQERIERSVKEEISANRTELSATLKTFEDSVLKLLTSLTQMNEQKLEQVRKIVEERLRLLQDENSRKLEQIRLTVDEKLHDTLEKRLGEKFNLVSQHLESVQRGLGEMQTLAVGVGDLKKVLTNVKTRGIWGEIQLGMLLEQILTNEQYAKNVVTKKDSNMPVEFAIKLPGRDKEENHIVWLPIDSKFPLEDYHRLIDAQEQGNGEMAEKMAKQLEIRIKTSAKDIKEKYLDPPNTTDFAIMFMPVEGLYAEVLRRPGLCELLQRDYRIVITGPTTLAALLNSLQMGFRTLAIEQRSSEVWSLLAVIKTEFAKFGIVLDRTRKKLKEATNTIDEASSKTRNIQNKLKKVQELPSDDSEPVIEDASVMDLE